MFDGMAKPRPMLPSDGDRICELMPISSPPAFTSAPPELPWLIARVGLQEVLVAAVAEAGLRALGADDARRHGLADAERVADRQHDVADLHRVGVAEHERRQVLRVDLHDREVGRGVGADDLRGERAVVGQLDLDVVDTLHDMVVGQDVAILARDDAGAEPALDARLRCPRICGTLEVAEEPPEHSSGIC